MSVELDHAVLRVNALDHVEAEVRAAILDSLRAQISETETTIYLRIRDAAGAGLLEAIRRRVSEQADFTLTETPATIFRITFAPASDIEAARRARDLGELANFLKHLRRPLPGVRIDDEIGGATVHADDPESRHAVAGALRSLAMGFKVEPVDEASWRVSLAPSMQEMMRSNPGGIMKMFQMSTSPGRALMLQVSVGDMLRDPPDLPVDVNQDSVEAWVPDPNRHAEYGDRLRRAAAAAGRSDLTVSEEPGLMLQIELAKPVEPLALADSASSMSAPLQPVQALFGQLSELTDPAVDVQRTGDALVVSTADPSRRSEVRGALAALGDIAIEERPDHALRITPTTALAAPPIPDVALLVQTVEARVHALGLGGVTTTPNGADRIETRFASATDADKFRRSVRSASTGLAFRFVDDPDHENPVGPPSPDDQSLPQRDPAYGRLWLRPEAHIRGDMIAEAQVGRSDYSGSAVIHFRLNEKGREAFSVLTSGNVGRGFAIVLDGVIISAPRIMSPIPGGEGTIECNCSIEQAQEIATKMKSYPADLPLKLVEPPAQ